MSRGTQIAYVPRHANGNIEHKDVQFGFVTSVASLPRDLIFCRYWSKHSLGKLRTKANSEATSHALLIEYDSVDQAIVDAQLDELGYGMRCWLKED